MAPQDRTRQRRDAHRADHQCDCERMLILGRTQMPSSLLIILVWNCCSAALPPRYGRLLNVEVLKVMCNCDRAIRSTLLTNTIRPDRVGQMCPVILTALQLLPALFRVFGPLWETEEPMERRGIDKDAIVEIWTIWESRYTD